MKANDFSHAYSMQKIIISSTLLIIFFFQAFNGFSATYTVGSGGTYSNLRLAFAAVNSGFVTGTIDFQIISSITDNNSAVLNASGSGGANYTSISVYPTSSGYSLTGSYNGALIDFNGADNVTIDGRVNKTGTTKSLTLSNTNTGNSAATVRFIESAQGNTVKYCTVIGVSQPSSLTTGTIFFTTASTGTGNDNNVIDNCNVTGRARTSIFSFGTAGKENSGITISNNNIYDNLAFNLQSSLVLYFDGNTTDCTITGNSFYDTTGTVTPTSVVQHYQFIRVSNVDLGGNIGNNFTVTNNYMGGTAPQCGGGNINIGIASPQSVDFVGIRLHLGTTTASTVQGNTIGKINFKSSYPSIPFYAMLISSGVVNVGTVTGNTIGSSTGTGSIQVISTVNASTYGIYLSSTSNIVVSNNTIGSITTSSSASNISNSFYAIYKSAVAGNLTVNNNSIGSLTDANNLNASSAATASDQLMCGIYTRGTGTTTINNNTIANITNGTTRNSATNGTYGINYGGPTSGTNTIYRNYIYKLGFAGTASTNSIMTGIDIYSGIANCFNNIVNIGSNVTSPLSIRGISCESTSTTTYIYHNTVYISGSVTGTTGNTYGFYR